MKKVRKKKGKDKENRSRIARLGIPWEILVCAIIIIRYDFIILCTIKLFKFRVQSCGNLENEKYTRLSCKPTETLKPRRRYSSDMLPFNVTSINIPWLYKLLDALRLSDFLCLNLLISTTSEREQKWVGMPL